MANKGFLFLESSHLAVKWISGCRPMQLRTFTSSAAWQQTSTVPVFKTTSSPELNELLGVMREKLFLPRYLTQKQRNLIYKARNKKVLDNEPVFAKIGEEEFRLQHIDIMNDLPAYFSSTEKAIALMEEKSDWENLPGLLEGVHKCSKGKWPISEKLLRRLSRACPPDVLLDCIRQASRTGLRLEHPNNAWYALQGMSRNAIESEWDPAETRKALRYSEQILELLEDPKHAPSGKTPISHAFRQPEVIGYVLEVAAIRATEHQDGRDIDGKVEQLAKKLLSCMENLCPCELKDGASEKQVQHARNEWLGKHLPLLHAITTALKVVDPESETAVQLKETAAVLREDVTSTYEELASSEWAKEKPRLAIALYQRLFGVES